MAEIRVEKTHRSSLWLWILALVVLALVVWAIAEMRDRNRGTVTDDLAAVVLEWSAPAPAALLPETLARCA